MLRLSSDDEVIFITAVVCCSIASLAVLIRLWCKAALKLRYQADDWLILIALVIYWATAGVDLWGIFASRDMPPEKAMVLSLKVYPSAQVANPEANLVSQQSAYFTQVLAYLVRLAFMLSVCVFYQQIFPFRGYRIASNWLMALTVAWFLGGELGWTFACTPISYGWNRAQGGSCIDVGKLSLAFATIQVVLLVAILLLPVRAVFAVQIPLRTKCLVSGIFFLGGISIVTLIPMLYYTRNPSTSPYGQDAFWLHIHIGTALTSACLPIYKPLRAKFAQGFSKLRNLSHTLLGRPADSQSSSKSDSTTSVPMPRQFFNHRGGASASAPKRFLSCRARDTKAEDSDDVEARAGIVPRGDGAENHTTVVAEQQNFASLPPLGIGVTKQYEVV